MNVTSWWAVWPRAVADLRPLHVVFMLFVCIVCEAADERVSQPGRRKQASDGCKSKGQLTT